ncbi:hypothetical protein GN244_ATG09136 [Phytophthora infestans]|uniref:Uncharacterized protein n=1 Tax=Phytophthora infestans TaxID=4787 RepID=A0A833SVL0_PHYIN|nr:hypothetical protein GN244_ATG09136 [Phytophthora infestans]KAF4144277.1 hypothetical protein GN958_ATG06598 [Phytophthora infestans]
MNGTDFARKTMVVEEAERAKIAWNADGGQALTLESTAKWKDYELCGGRQSGGSDECQKTNEKQTKDERRAKNEERRQ